MYKNITNHYDPGKRRPKLCCESRTLFEPTEDWSYAHHSFITFFKGNFYVFFSNGHFNEDDVGQRIMYCTAEDFDNWSVPQVVVDSLPGNPAQAVAIPSGVYTNGEQLILYYLHFEYTEDWLKDGYRLPGSKGRKNWGMDIITTTDGVHWTKPQPIAFDGGNQSPKVLRSGRLFAPGGIKNSYSDNPDGIHDWVTVECCPPGYPNCLDFDNGEGVSTESGVVGQTVGLCESSFIELDDGTIYLILRSGTDYLWASESHDNAQTWTLPQPTRFTDNRTKFHFGRLPNGKYFYIGTPDPFPPRTRHVLVLSLSDDGLDYNQHFILADTQYKGKYIGLDRNGIYGYPSTLIKDGYLYITVSICKEKIIILRVPCDTL